MAGFIPGVSAGRPAAARRTPPFSRSLSRSRSHCAGPSVVAVSVAMSVAVSVVVSASRSSFARTGWWVKWRHVRVIARHARMHAISLFHQKLITRFLFLTFGVAYLEGMECDAATTSFSGSSFTAARMAAWNVISAVLGAGRPGATNEPWATAP